MSSQDDVSFWTMQILLSQPQTKHRTGEIQTKCSNICTLSFGWKSHEKIEVEEEIWVVVKVASSRTTIETKLNGWIDTHTHMHTQ